MTQPASLYLGAARSLDGTRTLAPYTLPAHHLTTHGVVIGMTGSGKTGLLTVMVEEALRAQIPVLMFDVKGDLPNLLLSFPTFDASAFAPWVQASMAPTDTRSVDEVAQALAADRATSLSAWSVSEADVARFDASTEVRVITPGSTAGESLHVLSSLERRSPQWDTDIEAARAALSAAISLLLRLLKRDPDPAKSREHVLLSVLVEQRFTRGAHAELGALLSDILQPPIETIGALTVEEFLPKPERRALAAAVNALIASPSFSTWRQGTTLDVASWMTRTHDNKTPATIVSVAHLDDDERTLVLGVVLEELLSWVRAQPGSQRLNALVVFDEVYGFLPPHPANPPTKRPLVALMKQARAFGVGVVLATQNTMDLDYRALGNAGFWCIGRLQTDADRARVIDGLAEHGRDAQRLAATLKLLSPRWFVMRDTHAAGEWLLQPRCAMSHLRGPMTRGELRMALARKNNPQSATEALRDAAE